MSEITIEIFKILYLVTSAVSLWIVFSLLVKFKTDSDISLVFVIFILIMTLPVLNGYLALTPLALPDWILSFIYRYTWLYGPALWLVFKKITNNPVSIKVGAIHFVPFLLLGLLGSTGLINFDIWYIWATLGQLSIYLTNVFFKSVQHRRQLAILLSRFSSTNLYWLAYSQLGLLALIALDLYILINLTASGEFNQLFWQIMLIAISIYLLLLCAALLFIQPSDDQSAHDESEDTSDADSEVKEFKSITANAARSLADELIALMSNEKPYLNNGLTLKQLADQLGVTSHQLSETLNICLNKSFYDFLNQARIEHAMALMQTEPKQVSVLNIAYQSGFNNKNSFYKSFKLQTGETPAQYRNALRSDPASSASGRVESGVTQ